MDRSASRSIESPRVWLKDALFFIFFDVLSWTGFSYRREGGAETKGHLILLFLGVF